MLEELPRKDRGNQLVEELLIAPTQNWLGNDKLAGLPLTSNVYRRIKYVINLK